MRAEIIEYLQAQNLGTFTVSQDVPWDENGTPLYVKNLRRVYVSLESATIEPVVQALDGLNIQSEVTSVTVYFASDAKALAPNYSDVVASIKSASNITTVSGVNRREVVMSTDILNDLQVTELEIRFTKLI